MIQKRIVLMVRGRDRARTAAIVALAGGLLTSACASVPDAANPAHWYRSTVDYFGGDDKGKKGSADKAKKETAEARSGPAAERGQAPPGADQPFPKLSSVPERPQRQVAQGLVADPNRPRYAPAIPRQTEDAPPPAAAAAPAPTPQAPAAAPAPAPARVATAPTPPRAAPAPAAPVPPAARPMTVEETYRASLAQQQLLPSQLGAAPAGAISPAGEPTPTVVVSSGGVVMDAPMIAAAQSPAATRAGVPPLPVLTPVGPARAAAPAPRVAAAGRDIAAGGAGPTESSVKIATILFANGSSQVDGRGQQVLAQVAQLHRQGGGKLRVVGHASSRTRAMDPEQHHRVNLNVSAARASAVASELVRLGAQPENVLVSAIADSDPLYHEVMPTGEAGNRRAEVYIDR